ncbi:MAG: lamin tail domain-containing protein [Proteobacteria bacterium]|nr:lamin tail domain-containing protein [Pseudomonadota bacterium]MCP4920983.1 lamin tail domain-containing protein [Pseudomonadota bacterium]
MGLNSALVLSLLGCTDYEFFNQKHTDVFQQNSRKVVDILLVVDNSCSMYEEQNKLATNFDAFIQYFDGVDVDYQLAVITTDTVNEGFMGKFVGGDDEIILSGPTGALVDRVAYDRDWTIPEGASLSLDPSIESGVFNDVQENWCAATDDMSSGDYGTPGAANPACGAGGPNDSGDSTPPDSDDPAEEDSGDTVATPQAGDVIVTEFLANPAAVADPVGEWVELKNITDHDVDLSGSTLADGGRNLFTFPDGVVVAAGSYLVLARSDDSDANGGIEGAIALGEDFTLNDSVTVINADTDNASEVFAEQVAQGVSGSGIEMGLEAARMAFQDELLETTNAGFLREEANLSFIFVSDEDDDSPYAVDDYLRYYAGLKGDEAFRDHQMFNVSAVVGDSEPEFWGEPSCTSEDGNADYGKRYIDLASRTQGLVDSICDEDFSPIAADLGLILSGLAVEFELSAQPDETSIEVALYEDSADESFVRDLEKDVDFTYVRERNSIRFEEDQVPPPSWYFTVSYDVLATGASQGEGE